MQMLAWLCAFARGPVLQAMRHYLTSSMFHVFFNWPRIMQADLQPSSAHNFAHAAMQYAVMLVSIHGFEQVEFGDTNIWIPTGSMMRSITL